MSTSDLSSYCRELAETAQSASRKLAASSGAARSKALGVVAQRLIDQTRDIVAANARDVSSGKTDGLSPAMLDRLTLDAGRIAKMAQSVRQIAEQPDPLGQIIEGHVRPNGLRLEKVRVPLGVILIIFESWPNVTSDAAALCVKSGNAVILRGGKEALHSNAAIATCIRQGLAEAGLDQEVVQLVKTTDRAAVAELLKLEGKIDVCIPRGGESLIRAVVEQSRIPVIKHYTGNCHVYVDRDCDPDMARKLVLNAKCQRPGVCNAAETLLVHTDHAKAGGLLSEILSDLLTAGVEIRGDQRALAHSPKVKIATEEDWHTEYLDLILAVRVVDSLEQAIDHINRYGSRHTDAIVTRDLRAAEAFVARVDSANVMVNCSTRFSDGGEYGLGAEIGISTDKLHARGPMGAADLTTYKWVVRGDGQLRQ